MDYLVNAEEMRRADENTISYFGMPQLVLMERAALSSRDHIVQKWQELFTGSARILIAVGNGNNGGDGAALARLFYLQGHQVTVFVSGNREKYSPALKYQMEILEKYKTESEKQGHTDTGQKLHIITDNIWKAKSRSEKDTYDLVADALFGIGLSRPVSGIYKEKLEWLNRLSGKKAALDIPSGVSAEDGSVLGTAFRADLTVTFGFLKTGMLLYPGKELCGEIKTAEIGITAESFLGKYPAGITLNKTEDTLRECRNTFLCRTQNSHKGSYGKVLLFAGSAGAPGAALLAGEAVLRSGAGMLRLVSSPENRELVVTRLPEAMYQELTENTEWEKLIDWCDAVVAGPGVGQDQVSEKNLGEILTLMSEKNLRKPLVLDADGLNLVASSERLYQLVKAHTTLGGIVLITPHMAELARLLHCSMKELQTARTEKTEQYVRESGVILVSKDAATIVCYADEADSFHYYINQTGNNGMATAGSGDVLSGIMGAFAALTAVRQEKETSKDNPAERTQKKAAYFEAAYRAVYLHGIAGDKAAGKYGETSMKAGDITGALAELLMDR